MKKSLIMAGAAAMVASSAFAGGFSQPIAEPMIQEPMMPTEMVAENTSSSAGGYVVPVLLLVALAAAAANR